MMPMQVWTVMACFIEKHRSSGVFYTLAVALLAAGCVKAPPEQPSADLSKIYGQLADACRADRNVQVPTAAEASAVGAVGPARGALHGTAIRTAPGECLETGALPKAAPEADIFLATGVSAHSWGGAVTAKAANLDGADMVRDGYGLPRPLHLRYEPESVELRRNDVMALATKFAEVASRDDVRLAVTVGPGGNGNAFDQVALAHRRVRHLSDMLPKDLVTSFVLDPELANDSLVLSVIAAVGQ